MAPMVPVVSTVLPPNPAIVGQPPLNAALEKAKDIAALERVQKLLPGLEQRPVRQPKPSNPEAKQRSIHFQGQGDIRFKKQEYLRAHELYRQAYRAARDRPEPYFRMGFALAALGHHGSAVREFKRGLNIDRSWALTGASLEEIFGDNQLARNALLHEIAEWVREDIRDPDRLFLMGVMLYFDDDIDRALPFLQTADQLAGSPPHIRAFLHPPVPHGQKTPPKPPRPEPPPLPEPED